MKAGNAFLFFLLVLFAGCSTTKEVEIPTPQFELIDMTPLPPLQSTAFLGGAKLGLLLHVLKDGTVENVKILGPSGDGGWDSLAVQTIKQWRYAPPRRDGVPVDVWFRQLIVVQMQEPMEMALGRLSSASLAEADSLYALLEKGTVLDPVFKRSLATVNIMRFPRHIREKLKNLREDEYTRPLRLGEKYIIFKRFSKEVAKDLPE
jgi:TonB family protein